MVEEIEHITTGPVFLAGFRFILEEREQIRSHFTHLKDSIPTELVVGAPLLKLNYISSETSGVLADVGLPVSESFETEDITSWKLPPLQLMVLSHDGPDDKLGETYGKLFSAAEARGLISDEFGLEIYDDPIVGSIKVCFVIHQWEHLFRESLEESLGQEKAEAIYTPCTRLDLSSSLDSRFRSVRESLEILEEKETDDTRYRCLTSCAHVFPEEQIHKLRDVFNRDISMGRSPIEAVDSVLDFMERDHGWGERPRREGRTIYTSKKPRDVRAFSDAENDETRREAACFCPIIRKRLGEGMPLSFCYCGAGWFRQQWEGATGKPVRIEIVESLLSGDDRCTFAIHLSDSL